MDPRNEFQIGNDLPSGGQPSTLERDAAPRFGRGPKSYQRSDARIQEDISERLLHTHHIDSSDVSVSVDGGRVTFDGTVPSRVMKHQIEDLADRCPGVQDIQNQVRVAGSGDAT
jgi:osmotically-inducible protein OsmY